MRLKSSLFTGVFVVLVLAGGSAVIGWTRPPLTATQPEFQTSDPLNAKRSTGVVVQWMGSYSSIQTPRVEMIENASAWEALYTEHTREKPEKNANGFLTWPKIDFDKYLVLAVLPEKRATAMGTRHSQ